MSGMDRWLPVLLLTAWIGFALAVAGDAGPAGAVRLSGAGGLGGEGGVSVPVAQPYREGPLQHRAPAAPPSWPRGSRELMALGGLGAIVYGLRAAGLSRRDPGERRRAPTRERGLSRSRGGRESSPPRAAAR